MMRSTSLLAALIITVMMLPVLSPVIATASYTSDITLEGVIEKDRQDYMSAADNPLQEDVANYFFQGPGALSGSPSVGYMADLKNVVVTNWGTLYNMTYKNWLWEFSPQLGTVDLLGGSEIQQASPVPTPLEGWALYYRVTVYTPPVTLDNPSGIVVFTFSKVNGPGSISNDTMVVPPHMKAEIVDSKVLVNNPRLFVKKYVISVSALVNNDDPGTPSVNETLTLDFKVTIIFTFNKVTKFVQIKQKADLVKVVVYPGWHIKIDYGIARMAIIDANPTCDHALYGWAFIPVNVTCPACTAFYQYSDMTEYAFMVLSWVNRTIAAYLEHPDRQDYYYAAYALAFPAIDTDNTQLNFSYALVSVINAPSRAARLNTWNPLESDEYYRAVYLKLSAEGPGGIEPTGDQALVRFDWWTWAEITKSGYTGYSTTGWTMVVYGVYDVNDAAYDGGEGGVFRQGVFYDHNGVLYNGPVDTWNYTGTLGYLTGMIDAATLTAREGMLSKLVKRMDLNQDGVINTDPYPLGETNIPVYWYPTEELLWQLNTLFAPPTFSKLATDLTEADFIQVSSTVLTTDVIAATYLASRFFSVGKTAVIFDVELYGVENFPGIMAAKPNLYRPYTKLPYLALKLTPINTSTLPETVLQRRAHYTTDANAALTPTGRVLLQMHIDSPYTTWADVRYFVVASGGPVPNLVTRYFNDFAALVFSPNNDLGEAAVVAPATGDAWLWSSVVSANNATDNNRAFGVVAVARDHFNNTALIVWGARAPENYWLGYWLIAEGGLNYLITSCGTCSAAYLDIQYGTPSHEWGTGSGVPLIQHTEASVTVGLKYGVHAVYTPICGPTEEPGILIQEP